MKLTLLLLLCSSALLVHGHEPHELGPDHERHLHESQIPPPSSQPSKEEIQEILKEVFKKIDTSADGEANTEELRVWLDQIHNSLITENIEQQWAYYNPQMEEVHSWESYDPEKRESIAWEHYVNGTYPEDVIQYVKDHPDVQIKDIPEGEDPNFKNYVVMLRRALKRWKAADADQDNVLLKEEFQYFVHPEEGEKTKHILVEEALEDMDADGNGEVTLGEYIQHMSDVGSEEEKQDPNFLSNQQSQFATYLDKNKDGVLNKEELTEWLVPNYDRHEAEALRMIHDTDENHDLQLNVDEILKNDDYFLGLIPAEFWRKYSGDGTTPPTPHDEF